MTNNSESEQKPTYGFVDQLIDEKTQVDERKIKLLEFIDSPEFEKISKRKQKLLPIKLYSMDIYSDLLRSIIYNWTEDESMQVSPIEEL